MDCDGTIKLRRVKKKLCAGKKNSNLKKNRGDRKKGLVLHGVLTLHIVKPALILRVQIVTYAENTKLKSFVDLLKYSFAYARRHFDSKCPQRRMRYCILRSDSVSVLQMSDLLPNFGKILLRIVSKVRHRDTQAEQQFRLRISFVDLALCFLQFIDVTVYLK